MQQHRSSRAAGVSNRSKVDVSELAVLDSSAIRKNSPDLGRKKQKQKTEPGEGMYKRDSKRGEGREKERGQRDRKNEDKEIESASFPGYSLKCCIFLPK